MLHFRLFEIRTDVWDSFGFFLAICSAMLLVGSGIGWGLWAIGKKIRH